MSDRDDGMELLRARIHEMQGELERAKMIGDADGAIVCERKVSLLRQIIARLEAAEKMRVLLQRYREETPLGHQPRLIAHEADTAIAAYDAARRQT